MDIEEILKQMTLEEKALLITGAANMQTHEVERLGIEGRRMADGPHGVRTEQDKNATHFPNLCVLGSSWDKNAAYEMGEALGDDCNELGISMLLGPGINIKKNILCGRNFEYLAEDPVLAGELAAGYINGLQSKGIAASLKHYAANNQEKYRTESSSEIDERTLREIYLKGFEIAVKKSNPASVMCAYNKINSIWCSENKYLLTDILKKEWNYEGFVVSDWGAVHDICKALTAGLDLQMPKNPHIAEQVSKGIEEERLTVDALDNAVRRILEFIIKYKADKKAGYDRQKQHQIASKIASKGMVMLKNDNDTLPLTNKKYKKILVVGEFAKEPLICGQGSAEVKPMPEFVDSPLAELEKRLDGVEITYEEFYKKGEYSPVMLWPRLYEYKNLIEDNDLVVVFVGAMESDDTEYHDRRSAILNPDYQMFITAACETGKKVVAVLQSGGAMIINEWCDKADAIIHMGLGGESAGSAVADILCGIVNPSGKLSETFPNRMRTDIEYPGNGLVVEYSEKLNVGYRYYDKHPEEICYPFGYGLSYTDFEYSNCDVSLNDDIINVEFDLKNTGEVDGAEVFQIYVNDPVAAVTKPIKELKYFDKAELKSGEIKHITVQIPVNEIAYYNIMLKDWVVESGQYNIMIGASSRDIRLTGTIYYENPDNYTIQRVGADMIG